MKGKLGRLLGVFEVSSHRHLYNWQTTSTLCKLLAPRERDDTRSMIVYVTSRFMVCLLSPKQNQDRKHRTYVYVLTVTETLEAWEDSVNIGTG